MVVTKKRPKKAKTCPFTTWYNANARWQPKHPLSIVVQEIMREQLCNCGKHK